MVRGCVFWVASVLVLVGCVSEQVSSEAFPLEASNLSNLNSEQVEDSLSSVNLPAHVTKGQQPAYLSGYKFGLELGPSGVGHLFVAPKEYLGGELDEIWVEGARSGSEEAWRISYDGEFGSKASGP